MHMESTKTGLSITCAIKLIDKVFCDSQLSGKPEGDR